MSLALAWCHQRCREKDVGLRKGERAMTDSGRDRLVQNTVETERKRQRRTDKNERG